MHLLQTEIGKEKVVITLKIDGGDNYELRASSEDEAEKWVTMLRQRKRSLVELERWVEA